MPNWPWSPRISPLGQPEPSRAAGILPRRHTPVLAGRITRGSSIARTVRARRWPKVLVAGLVLVILGVTLMPSESRPGVIILGVIIVLQAAARGLVRQPTDQDRKRVPSARSAVVAGRRSSHSER